MAAVAVHAFVVARPEAVDDVREACLAIVDDVVREDGCLTYHLLEGSEDPRVFGWFERWRDEDSFDRHLAGEPAQRLGAALEGRLAEPMVITRYALLV